MAHYRKPLAAAAALNTAIFVGEAVAGLQADSLTLLMDSVHNLSDEMALVFLYFAFVLPHGISRHLLRSANVFNSIGLLLISALLLWQACERILYPAPVVGSITVVVGLLAAAANWGVAPAAARAEPQQRGDPAGLYSQFGRRLRVLCAGRRRFPGRPDRLFDVRSPHRRRHRRVDHRLHDARGFWLERRAHLARENRLRPFQPRGSGGGRHVVSVIAADRPSSSPRAGCTAFS